MSHLIAKITHIHNIDSLHILKLAFYNYELEVISLDLAQDVAINTRVSLNVKPSSIILSKLFHNDISCNNQLQATIISIDKGELLYSMLLKVEEVELESIVTKEYMDNMKFKIQDKVVLLIKSSDMYIEEVLK